MKKILRNKQVGQAGFADVMTAELGGTRTAEMLAQLARAIDWARLARPMERAAYLKDASQPGRAHGPVVVMIKCLMLARWFNLSDPQLQESLLDRLSFRRFVGLALGDATADETTLVRFGDLLLEHDLERSLFEAVLEQLQERQLIVKQGTWVDAKILAAPAPRNPRNPRNPRTMVRKDDQDPSTISQEHSAVQSQANAQMKSPVNSGGSQQGTTGDSSGGGGDAEAVTPSSEARFIMVTRRTSPRIDAAR